MQSFHKPSRGFLQTIVKAAFDLEVNWVLNVKRKRISSYSQLLKRVQIYTGVGEALKQVSECWMKASTQTKPKRKKIGPRGFDSNYAEDPRKRPGKATRTNKRREYLTEPWRELSKQRLPWSLGPKDDKMVCGLWLVPQGWEVAMTPTPPHSSLRTALFFPALRACVLLEARTVFVID